MDHDYQPQQIPEEDGLIPEPPEQSRLDEFKLRIVSGIEGTFDNIVAKGPGWKRQAAAVAAAGALHFGILASGGAATAELVQRAESDEPPVEHTQKKPTGNKADLDGNGTISADEVQLISTIPRPDKLAPVSPQPIADPYAPPEANSTENIGVPGYQTRFLGSYQTRHGIGFNIFAGVQEGQEPALDQQLEIHPETIEFMLTQIRQHIGAAPDNDAKRAIIKNLADSGDGTDKILVSLVVDVSPEAGCLDSEYQLIEFVERLCKAGGVNEKLSYEDGEKPMKIIISTGVKQVNRPLNQAEKAEMEKAFGEDMGEGGVATEIKPDIGSQQATLGHELVHSVSQSQDKGENDTYKEGDQDHEITAWLMGDSTIDEFDLAGADKPSPELRQKILKLVSSGLLPPIIGKKASTPQP